MNEPSFGEQLPSIVVTPPGPKTQAFAHRLRSVESRNVTFLSEGHPVFWESAKGGNVRDVDGNVFLDFTSAFGVALSGHGDPKIVECIQEQAQTLVHGMGDYHPPAAKVDFLEALGEVLPWDDSRAVLASSGSEAVEIALKTAHLVTGRGGVVAFAGAYHGLTLGALSVTDRALFRLPFTERLASPTTFLPFATEGSSAERSLGALEHLLSESKDDFGALILEPIQGRGGIHIPPSGWLESVVQIARASGLVVIFDEIFTGCGRTGLPFAFQHEDDVLPDLICLGKALGGGLPLSVCAGPRAIMDAWPESGGEAAHTSTFLGHPLACAAGLTFLHQLRSDGLCDRARALGQRLLSDLSTELSPLPSVRDVRGRGLMIGIELCDPGSGEVWAGGGPLVANECLRRGLIVLPAGPWGEVVEVTPSATLTDQQVTAGVQILGEAIQAATAGLSLV